MDSRTKRTIDALRTPDASLRTCPNTVRQSIADVVQELQTQVDKYGVALMMIREGCDDPESLAGDALRKFIDRTMEVRISDAPQIERIDIGQLCKAFGVSAEKAKHATETLGFIYRIRA